MTDNRASLQEEDSLYTAMKAGNDYYAAQDFVHALEQYHYAQALHYTLYGDKGALEKAGILNQICESYYGLGEYEESISCFHEALKILENAENGMTFIHKMMILNNLGIAYGDVGKHEQACDYINQSIEVINADSVYLPSILFGAARIFANAGKDAEALGYLKKSIESGQKMYASDHPFFHDITIFEQDFYENLLNKYGDAFDTEAIPSFTQEGTDFFNNILHTETEGSPLLEQIDAL